MSGVDQSYIYVLTVLTRSCIEHIIPPKPENPFHTVQPNFRDIRLVSAGQSGGALYLTQSLD